MPAATTTTTKPRPAKPRATKRATAPSAKKPAAAQPVEQSVEQSVAQGVRISPTRALGIQGWTEQDPLILAALALEAPLLLVGAHGTAKTLLVERVAVALGSAFRHYNASLLNYDDLVGIPIPDEVGGLRFVGTEGAVWGAGFVFFDEINRCRPDLQNKMFPLVHERRIGGVDLPDLVHRWAAMNPPHVGEDLGGYLGTEPLDTALADRFWLVVRTPGWSELSRAERTALVAGAHVAPDGQVLVDALARTLAALPDAEADVGELATRYVVTLTDTLGHAGVAISPRRASILRRTIVAAVAASRALGRADDPAAVFELVVRNGLPQLAEGEPPEAHRIVAAHLQAFDLSGESDGSLRRRLLEEPNPVRRIHLALEDAADGVADEVLLAGTVTSALSAQPTVGEQVALSAVLHLALAEHDLTPAAWSAIALGARTVLVPSVHTQSVGAGRHLERWREATGWLAANDHTALEEAVLQGLGPDLLADLTIDGLVDRLRGWTTLFGVSA
jgi:MoxR-like ATPase